MQAKMQERFTIMQAKCGKGAGVISNFALNAEGACRPMQECRLLLPAGHCVRPSNMCNTVTLRTENSA